MALQSPALVFVHQVTKPWLQQGEELSLNPLISSDPQPLSQVQGQDELGLPGATAGFWPEPLTRKQPHLTSNPDMGCSPYPPKRSQKG